LQSQLKAQNMSIRQLAWLFAAALALALPESLLAQEDGGVLELKRLRLELSMINAEIKSELDQVLVLQEAIRANARIPLEEQGRSPDIVMVDDVATAQRLAVEREAALNVRLEALFVRNAELDAKKQGILERVRTIGESQ
jgi:hypothetical protein